jgi:hypothetical protein
MQFRESFQLSEDRGHVELVQINDAHVLTLLSVCRWGGGSVWEPPPRQPVRVLAT